MVFYVAATLDNEFLDLRTANEKTDKPAELFQDEAGKTLAFPKIVTLPFSSNSTDDNLAVQAFFEETEGGLRRRPRKLAFTALMRLGALLQGSAPI